MDGGFEFAFDGAVAVGGSDFVAVEFAEVKRIDGSAFLGGNLGGGDVEIEFGEDLGNRVEEADAVFGFYFDNGTGFGGFVVEVDAGGDFFAGVALVHGAGAFLFGDESVEIEFFTGKGLVEEPFEFVALLGAGEVAGAGVGDEEGIEDDAVAASEYLRGEDVEAGSAKGAGDLAEEAGAVPGADFDGATAAVGFIMPIDDGREGGVFFGNLQAHEAMAKDKVLQDFGRGMDLEITGGKTVEVGADFLVAEALGNEFADFVHEELALFFLGFDEFSAAAHQTHGLVMKSPEQRILEAVPEFVTGGERVGES